MMKTSLLSVALVLVALNLSAEEPKIALDRELKITADRISADRRTGSLLATGHVVATSAPYRLMSPACTRDADHVTHFADPTTVTTCTNAVGSLHWSLTGELTYCPGDHVEARDAVARFLEMPFLWLPYAYYPLDPSAGWRIIPGYNKRWGGFLLTKYLYHLYGDGSHEEDSWWLDAYTRFDIRTENGVALGQGLSWGLGEFGRGKFSVYYAWDLDADRYDADWDNTSDWNYQNWSSTVPDQRYMVSFEHTWDVTERDLLRVNGSVLSDNYFYSDFDRNVLLASRSLDDYYSQNEIAWEHVETWSGLGLSVSGPLNDFYAGTKRLPEIYFDVAPLKVWSLPVNYESSTRIGWLGRQAARYGTGSITAYSYNPGPWADYETFRFDTYHRLTLPFTVADVVSVVPRVAYHGTYWNDSGMTDLTGWNCAESSGDSLYRSIVEGGITFAGRGVADYDGWRHVLEPYFDVLAQEAIYAGDSDGTRPYVFDAIDASRDWNDQFAGRGRNLPYSYYGVTPGLRQAFQKADEKGNYRTFLDFDVYAAIQFNQTDYLGTDENHRLAEIGKPNYGDGSCVVVPGFRVRYMPDRDTMIGAYLEYDSDNSRVAQSGLRLTRRVNDAFRWFAGFRQGDYRIWDFSSSPYDPTTMDSDDFNRIRLCYAELGFVHDLCDAWAWSPFVRWDCRENELDTVGAWLDYRLDCLGFRLTLSYNNAYTRIDGSEYEEDYSISFQVYLRCFGLGDTQYMN